MNYQRIYEDLIKKAKLKNRIKYNGIYYENHHIKPKCLDGGNEKNNLILLTGKEHFVAHKLLTKIHPNNKKLALAFHYMIYGNKKYKTYNISSKDYQYSKELILLNSKPLSKETKLKISNSEKGKIVSYETKQKISKANKGRTFSEKVNKSKGRKGEENFWFNKQHSNETKQKIKNTLLNRKEKISNDTRKKISLVTKNTIWITNVENKINKRINFIDLDEYKLIGYIKGFNKYEKYI
jgi:hypothetical protein